MQIWVARTATACFDRFSMTPGHRQHDDDRSVEQDDPLAPAIGRLRLQTLSVPVTESRRDQDGGFNGSWCRVGCR
jgi:hypothetical protein